MIKKIKNKKMIILLIFGIITSSVFSTSSIVKAENYNVSTRYLSSWTWVDNTSQGLHGNVPFITVNGEVSWCLQPHVVLQTGSNSLINFSDIGIDDDKSYNLSLIANFGYHTQPNEDNYTLVQNLIYRYLGEPNIYGVSSKYPTIQSQEPWFNDVMAKVEAYKTGMSFHNQSFELNVGQTMTLLDTNNVLSTMEILNTSGLNARIDGNNLVVTGTIEASDTSTIILKKPIKNETSTNFVVSKNGSQALSICKTKDPKNGVVNFKVNKYIDVNLNKVDKNNNSLIAQGDSTLIGAEYSLFNSNNQLLETKVINNDGKLKFEKLFFGSVYYIKETKASQGYLLNDEVITINPSELYSNGLIASDLQYYITSKEQVKKQAFALIKINSGGSSTEVPTLENVEFTVKLSSEVDKIGWENAKTYDILTTDGNGFALSKELPYGVYIVKETKTPLNYITAKDFIVTINDDNRTPQTYRIINNASFKAYLKIIKVDSVTKEKITFNNATFQIKDENGKVVSQKVGDKYITTFTTNENGIVTTPLMLGAGNYTIEEIETPQGYLTLEVPFNFEINSQEVVLIDDDNDPIIEVMVKNEKPSAKIIVNKIFEKSENLNNDNLYAKFKLVVNTDIINPADGNILYHKGDVISNLNSEDGLYLIDENNQLVIDNLPMSISKTEYKLIEVETNFNYQLSEPLIFTFEQTDNITKEYTSEKDLENKLIKTDIIINKKDEYSNDMLLNLDNISFTAYLDEKCTNVYDVVKVDTTTGKAIFKGVKYGQTLYIKETSTNNKYYLSDEVIKVIVNEELEGVGDKHIIDYFNKPIPTLKTKATGLNGEKEFNTRIDNTIIDVIKYENIDISKKYTIVTKLIKKSTLEVVSSKIENDVIFNTHSGEYPITIEVKKDTLSDSEYYFSEYIYNSDDNIEESEAITYHDDMNDIEQTIYMKTTNEVITGDNTNILRNIGVCLISFGTIVIIYGFKTKKVKRKN